MGVTRTIKNILDQVRIKPKINERIKYWAYGPEFRRWCKVNACESVPDRYALYQWLLEHTKLDGPIDYIEFGVSHGDSVRWWVDHNKHPETTFVGFDSFAGLPEKWQAWGEGSFSTGGKIPLIEDSRCKFVKGFFDSTVPAWVNGREFSRRTVLHLDADLYTSTLLVLTQLLPKLKPGSIMIFDEFADPLHEYRAYCDAMAAYRRATTALVRDADWTHVALEIKGPMAD
jgi:O-methyltransferase